jgi:phosphoglycerol transferase MdoB-like AlkP superfamily enzyme
LDRFNPYAAFLDPTLPSLARAARDAGYVTVCVHPFDMRFYERHRALQMLGFDHLIGQEAFGAARRDGQYVADVEVAKKVNELLGYYGHRTFIVAITMENHGPWEGMSSLAPSRPLPEAIAGVPDAEPFGRWLRHAQGTDSMVPILTKSLHDIADATGETGWLMVYGDHQPSLPKALHALGVGSEQTDYVIWRTHPRGAGRTVDLSADELPAELIGAMDVDVRTTQRVSLA